GRAVAARRVPPMARRARPGHRPRRTGGLPASRSRPAPYGLVPHRGRGRTGAAGHPRPGGARPRHAATPGPCPRRDPPTRPGGRAQTARTERPSRPATATLTGAPRLVGRPDRGRPTLRSEPVESPAEPSTTGGFFAGVRLLARSEEHTSELQSRENLVCRLLLEKKKCQL